MWEEGAPFLRTPGVSKNFPYNSYGVKGIKLEWTSPWIWEEGAPFFRTLRVFKNFSHNSYGVKGIKLEGTLLGSRLQPLMYPIVGYWEVGLHHYQSYQVK